MKKTTMSYVIACWKKGLPYGIQVEKDKFSLRCRLPEGEIPQAMALIVNKTSIDQLTKVNLSHYQMLGETNLHFSIKLNS